MPLGLVDIATDRKEELIQKRQGMLCIYDI